MAVIFELESSICDPIQDLLYSYNIIRKQLELPTISIDQIKNRYTGSFSELLVDEDLQGHKYSLEEIEQKFIDVYKIYSNRNTKIISGIEPVLAKLEAHNIPFGIISSKTRDIIEKLIKQINYSSRVQFILRRDDLADLLNSNFSGFFANSVVICANQHTIEICNSIGFTSIHPSYNNNISIEQNSKTTYNCLQTADLWPIIKKINISAYA